MFRSWGGACALVLLTEFSAPAAEELTVTLEYLQFDLTDMPELFQVLRHEEPGTSAGETAMLVRDVAPRTSVFRGVFLVTTAEPVKHVIQLNEQQVKIVIVPPDELKGDTCWMEIRYAYESLKKKPGTTGCSGVFRQLFRLGEFGPIQRIGCGETRDNRTGALVSRQCEIWYGEIRRGSPHVHGIDFKEDAQKPARTPDALDRQRAIPLAFNFSDGFPFAVYPAR